MSELFLVIPLIMQGLNYFSGLTPRAGLSPKNVLVTL